MQPVVHSTFTIDRTYPATPARVFAAFSDPAKKRRWFLQGGNREVEFHEMDFRVGGTERAGVRHGDGPMAGVVFTNETIFLDIQRDSRIVFAYTMAMSGSRFSASLVTLELAAGGSGTRLTHTHQGAYFEGADGPANREDGWRKLLDRLGDYAAQAA